MAYFRICALKKRGQVFTRVGLLVNLYSVSVGFVCVNVSFCSHFQPFQSLFGSLYVFASFRSLFESISIDYKTLELNTRV